jgi:hypothetical protein
MVPLRKLNLYMFENRSIKRFSEMYKLIAEVGTIYQENLKILN